MRARMRLGRDVGSAGAAAEVLICFSTKKFGAKL